MLKIVARLSTQIILSPDAHLTLDSVLHHALMEKFDGDEIRATNEMPLEISGSVFKASAAFFPNRAHYSRKTRTASLRGDNDAGTRLFKPNGGRGKEYAPFQVVRNTHGVGAVMDKYQSIKSPYVFWFADGDDDEIKELLGGLIGLGRRYTSGHGQIESVSAGQTEGDFSLVLPNGRPARPIPVSEWSGNVDDLRMEKIACVPPYFSTAPRECVMHDTRFVDFQ